MRIVSLVPSITLALHQLGLDDQLVGVTDYCIHPEELVKRLPRVGGTKNPDLEKIRGLRPDLVIANTDEQRAETLQELEAGPWDVLVTETDSLQETADTWDALGAATGKQDEARAQRRILEKALDRARARMNKRPRLDALVPVWKNPWMAAGGGTYLGDLLAACGFCNILADVEEKWVLFALTTDEHEAKQQRPTKGPFKDRTLLALPRSPDVVLLPTEPYAFKEADRETFAGIGVPADLVFIVDGERLTWWLSHTAKALDHFSALHERAVEQMNGAA